MRLCAFIAALALSSAALAAPPAVVLGAAGLRLGAGKATFGQPRGAVLKTVGAALGKPLTIGTYPDCGQGDPMSYATYRGGLELAFLKGRFSGWTVQERGNAAWRTARGIGQGATRLALKKAYPKVTIDDSSLGTMFTTEEEDGVSGFLDNGRAGAKIVSLYAGETCMIS